MNRSKNLRLVLALLLIIVTMAVLSSLCNSLSNFAAGLSVRSFDIDEDLRSGESGLGDCWGLIVNETDVPEEGVGLCEFHMDVDPDGSIESFNLKYNVQDGDLRYYHAIYSNSTGNPGGSISVKEIPFAQNYYPTGLNSGPGYYLESIGMINLSDIGYSGNKTTFELVDADEAIMYPDDEYRFYIMKKDGPEPFKFNSSTDLPYGMYTTVIYRLSCSDYYGNLSCSYADPSVVFTPFSS